MRLSIGHVVVIVALAACASASEDRPQAAARPAKELVSGSARVRGGGMRMDVQVGGAFGKQPVRGGTVVVTPTAVVTP